MLHRYEVKVSVEMADDKNITDEFFYRNMAHKMVREIPFDELCKIISFKKTHPFSEETRKRLIDYDLSDYEAMNIRMLKKQRLCLFEAEINLK